MAKSINFEDITVEQHFFPHINLTAKPGYVRNSGEAFDGKIDSRIIIKKVENKADRYLSELRITIDAKLTKNAPYSLDIVCICFMLIPSSADENEKIAAATELGHEIMFPAIRELVLSLTARQPWGQFSIGFGKLDPETEPSEPPKKRRAPRKPSTRKRPTA